MIQGPECTRRIYGILYDHELAKLYIAIVKMSITFPGWVSMVYQTMTFTQVFNKEVELHAGSTIYYGYVACWLLAWVT